MSGEVKAARVADVKAEDKEVVVDGVAREDEVVEVEEEEDCIEGRERSNQMPESWYGP